MFYYGNKLILENHKIGFLYSCKVPANIILKTCVWAIEQRDKGVCIVSGFHSKIEKDVYDILVKRTQPIILILARGFLKRWDEKIIRLIEESRLLIISTFNEKVIRPTKDTALKRNELVLSLSDEVFIPFAKSNSSFSLVIKKYNSKISTF
jgi:predicted Rossmann fold nucleotide-binding protein DprA/Smf involved in DNA uptake